MAQNNGAASAFFMFFRNVKKADIEANIDWFRHRTTEITGPLPGDAKIFSI